MAYPTTPVFQSVNLKSNDKTLTSQTVNGRTQSRKLASQYWEFSAKYPPMTQADFMPVYAYVMKQQGQSETFTVRIPVLEDARGTASGTFKVNGAKSAGQTTIVVDGITGTIVEGDLIKFSHDKVYMVVGHTETSSNTTSIDIQPPLRSNVADNETITYDNVTMKVRLRNDVQSFGMSNDGLFRYEVDFIEAL
jgi:hypothetical protein